VRVDVTISNSLRSAAAEAASAEAAGYDAAWVAETNHDVFLPLVGAGSATDGIALGTSIAVAFARSPMVTAAAAWDVNEYCGGRFVLGLGSQVKAHIERRFSMPWSAPARRMREYVGALRAIWRSWQLGEPLEFAGEFYAHTLMPPFFRPEPNDFGAPRVMVAAVGEAMTRTAAEVADGLFVHPFTTRRWLDEHTLPVVTDCLAARAVDRSSFELSCAVFVVTGRDEAELARACEGTRKQIAFYGSTPSYRPVLELHGWGHVQDRLHELSRSDGWDQMTDLVPDEMLEAFAVVAAPGDVGPALIRRFAGALDRVSLYTPYELDLDARMSAVRSIRAAAAAVAS
jgi:probable F420-dependent oxidoreductase